MVARFAAGLRALGVPYGQAQGYTLGGFRGGGITAYFEATGDLQLTRWRGRWNPMRSMEHYIQELASHEALRAALLRAVPVALLPARAFDASPPVAPCPARARLAASREWRTAPDALAVWALLAGLAAVSVLTRAAPPSASLTWGLGVVGVFASRARARSARCSFSRAARS